MTAGAHRIRHRRVGVAGSGVVALFAAYGYWVLAATELPTMAYLIVVGAVLLLDGLLLWLASKGRSRGVAIR